jgi:GNAT superfamily N-acetyltransferase
VHDVVVRRIGDGTHDLDGDRRAVAILRRRWSEEDAGGPIDDPGYEDRAAGWIEAHQSHRLLWLAEREGRPIGFVTAVPLDRLPQPGTGPTSWAYVHHLFVVAEQRDLGVGRLLLDAVVAEGEVLGWERLLLHPRDRSRPFYERAGFVTADRWLVRPLGPSTG